jgi:ABC-2 type transport system ATP-binding protein
VEAAVEGINLSQRFVRKKVNSGSFNRWLGGFSSRRAARPGGGGPDWIVAVDDVSLEVGRGEVFGLLGPNGAGKTTLIRILATLLQPTSGRAAICGYDTAAQPMQARASLGAVLAGERSLYWKLSGRENLEYFGALYHLPRARLTERIAALLSRMELTDRADELVERYSTGMKQRLSLARALLPDPPVLLLDEPTLGLDPQSARRLRELVLTLKSEGRAVLLTTHYMEEADFLCDRVAIIDHGRVIALDTPSNLKRNLPRQHLFRLELAGVNGSASCLAERVPGLEVLDQRLAPGGVSTLLVVSLAEPRRDVGQLWNALAAEGMTVLNYSVKEPTLEDVFITLTGRALRD